MWARAPRSCGGVRGAAARAGVAPTFLFADCREGQSRLNRNYGLFLPRCDRHARSGSGTDARADRGAFASAR